MKEENIFGLIIGILSLIFAWAVFVNLISEIKIFGVNTMILIILLFSFVLMILDKLIEIIRWTN